MRLCEWLQVYLLDRWINCFGEEVVKGKVDVEIAWRSLRQIRWFEQVDESGEKREVILIVRCLHMWKHMTQTRLGLLVIMVLGSL